MDGGVKMIPEPCFQELLPTPPTTQFYRPVTDHGIFPDLKTRYASDCIGWPAFTERYADLLQVDEDLSSYIRSGR
jgi:peptide methionine sulfoxide reductase MsrB